MKDTYQFPFVTAFQLIECINTKIHSMWLKHGKLTMRNWFLMRISARHTVWHFIEQCIRDLYILAVSQTNEAFCDWLSCIRKNTLRLSSLYEFNLILTYDIHNVWQCNVCLSSEKREFHIAVTNIEIEKKKHSHQRKEIAIRRTMKTKSSVNAFIRSTSSSSS